MATMAKPHLEDTSTSLDKGELLSLIEEEARLVGLSAPAAIETIKKGKAAHGYIWDDLSLLVALLSE